MATDLEAIPEVVVVIPELKKVPKVEAEIDTVGAWRTVTSCGMSETTEKTDQW
jgi:hypothetical protein